MRRPSHHRSLPRCSAFPIGRSTPRMPRCPGSLAVRARRSSHGGRHHVGFRLLHFARRRSNRSPSRLLDPSMANRKQVSQGALPRPSTRLPIALIFCAHRLSVHCSAPATDAVRCRAILLTLAVAVIADGFFGHPMAPMNLAGVLPWTYGRAIVVVALLTVGNFFCMACPFTLPARTGASAGVATRPWPRAFADQVARRGSSYIVFLGLRGVRSLG